MPISYKDAGVDIDAGDRLVERIKPLARRTTRPEVLGGLGGFAGLCGLPAGYRDPVLVSGTDGVGTKIKTAVAMRRHRTIGVDLVAMCVNDVAVTGAEPLFFLDYFASGKLDLDVGEQVITGIADGCRQAGCALIGGETAELPGMYQAGEYDLAGFCVGVVERSEIRDGSAVALGDKIIGLASSGLHSNGHSLARRVLLDMLDLNYDSSPEILAGLTVGEELLRPTKIYVKALAALRKAAVPWHAAAHITGGGLVENPPRMLPSEELAIELKHRRWPQSSIFALIESAGVPVDEMRRTFNLGLGLLIACAPADADAVIAAVSSAGENAMMVGDVVKRTPGGPAVLFT